MRPDEPSPAASTPTSASPRYRPGPHRVALLAAAFTLPLLFVGGSVTSYGVGMAVPDWPTTFGVNMFLYNFWNDSLGVKLEHTHRLYGAAVGLATIVLTVWLLGYDRRRYMKVLGVIALAAVIAQGVMGGLRVARISTFLAAFHGCFAQAFFGFMVVLCVLTGRVWQTAGPAQPDRSRLRVWAALMLALVYGQIVVGAWFRHQVFKTPAALWSHIAVAMAVLGLSHAMAGRVRRGGDEAVRLRPSSTALAVLATIQVGLGVFALGLMLPLGGNGRPPTLWEAMARTAHQTNGALLLAAAVVLALRAFGHLVDAPADPNRNPTEPAPQATEALA
jgi:heme a synthase